MERVYIGKMHCKCKGHSGSIKPLLDQILGLKLKEFVDLLAHMVDSLEGFLLELLELLILLLLLFNLLELLVQLMVEGVQDGRLERQRAAPDREDTHWQHLLHHEHPI
jgi:hypothetical protein